MQTAIKFCKVHHFADDTNCLHINNSIKKLNKFVDFRLKNLSNCINANKISQGVKNTELTMFKPRMKILDFDIKLKLNGKVLYPSKSVKDLGVKIDENFSRNKHLYDTGIKLSQVNTILHILKNL